MLLWNFVLIYLSDRITGKSNWTFMDGRATGENHVMNLKEKFGLQVSTEEIAGQFGRHSKQVIESNYLNKKKSTNAIEAYNVIREIYDTTGFDENEKIDPFIKQKNYCRN